MARIEPNASVITTLYVEKAMSGAARDEILRLRESAAEFHAPNLLLIECANALWKRAGAVNSTGTRR